MSKFHTKFSCGAQILGVFRQGATPQASSVLDRNRNQGRFEELVISTFSEHWDIKPYTSKFHLLSKGCISMRCFKPWKYWNIHFMRRLTSKYIVNLVLPPWEDRLKLRRQGLWWNPLKLKRWHWMRERGKNRSLISFGWKLDGRKDPSLVLEWEWKDHAVGKKAYIWCFLKGTWGNIAYWSVYICKEIIFRVLLICFKTSKKSVGCCSGTPFQAGFC